MVGWARSLSAVMTGARDPRGTCRRAVHRVGRGDRQGRGGYRKDGVGSGRGGRRERCRAAGSPWSVRSDVGGGRVRRAGPGVGSGPSVIGGSFTSSAEGRARADEAMLAKLREMARDGAVLAVEDVHWADTSTLDFLAHLCRNLPESGLLVVFSWRDEETDPGRERWIGEQLRNPRSSTWLCARLTLAETIRQLTGYPARSARSRAQQKCGQSISEC